MRPSRTPRDRAIKSDAGRAAFGFSLPACEFTRPSAQLDARQCGHAACSALQAWSRGRPASGQQAVDTTTAAGKAMFQMLGVFAEFERAIDPVPRKLASASKMARRPRAADRSDDQRSAPRPSDRSESTGSRHWHAEDSGAGGCRLRNRAADKALRGSKAARRGGPVVDGNRGAAANRAKAKAFAERRAAHTAALRAVGKGLTAIAAQLTTQGIVTPRGRAWTATGVWRVLRAG